MIQIKIMDSENISDLENNVNKWIKENKIKVINVYMETYFVNDQKSSERYHNALIIYEEL